MLGTQTTCTQVKARGFAIDHSGNGLYIGQPAASAMLFRMAYLIAKVGCFPTEITFVCQIT